MDEREGIIDWLRLIHHLLEVLLKWLETLPARLGAGMSEVTFEMRVGFVSLLAVMLLCAWIGRKK